MADSSKIALPGSERTPVAGATQLGPTDPAQLVEVSVVLKQRRELKLHDLQGKILSHDEFASTYGADPQHIERVLAFARANNLTFVEHGDEIARRTVKLQGTVANLEKAFGVKMETLMRMQSAYEIAQTRKREKLIKVQRITQAVA